MFVDTECHRKQPTSGPTRHYDTAHQPPLLTERIFRRVSHARTNPIPEADSEPGTHRDASRSTRRSYFEGWSAAAISA